MTGKMMENVPETTDTLFREAKSTCFCLKSPGLKSLLVTQLSGIKTKATCSMLLDCAYFPTRKTMVVPCSHSAILVSPRASFPSYALH